MYFPYFVVTDDITVTADGTDTYHLVKSAGKYKWVPTLSTGSVRAHPLQPFIQTTGLLWKFFRKPTNFLFYQSFLDSYDTLT